MHEISISILNSGNFCYTQYHYSCNMFESKFILKIIINKKLMYKDISCNLLINLIYFGESKFGMYWIHNIRNIVLSYFFSFLLYFLLFIRTVCKTIKLRLTHNFFIIFNIRYPRIFQKYINILFKTIYGKSRKLNRQIMIL